MPIFSSLQEATWNTLFSTKYEKGVSKSDEKNLGIKILKIPTYQRAYVWDHHKVSSLLSSITTSFMQNKSYYFIGNIVLCKEHCDSNLGGFFIVDGQQRLTTLTIIISTIRFIARENSYREIEKKCNLFLEVDEHERRDKRIPELKFRLCLPDIDKMNYGSEFRNYIQMSKIHELRNFHNKGKNRVISEYVERLQSNSNQVFDDLCDKQERYLYNLVRYISGSCKFTIMVTDQFLDAHRIFCNLNLSGEPLSPLDLYRARFYGQMVNEKGLSEANRSIDSKLKIWNKIHAELGNSEMSCFLSHVCRIKLVERNDEEKFIASFSYKEEQVINFLGECTDNIQASEEFFKQVETLLAIWNKIFRSSEPNASRDALKLIRSNHYEVWITMALTAGYHNVLLNKDFWMSLDKYITILMVVLSSRYACSYSESNEVLHRCYKNIKWTLEWKEISLTLEPFEINEFKERIQGDLYTNITEYCIVYLLMRIALGKKSELTKNSQSIEKMAVDLVTPLNFNTSDDDSILSRYAGHIGNLILVDSAHLDKFRNKSWAEKKSNIGFAKVYPSTVTVLSLDVWNVESFKRVQEYYISLIGKCYEIAELKDYKMSFVQKRKLNVIQLDDNSNASAREDIAVVECVANNETVAPVSKKRKIQEVTTSNKIDDYTILLAATQLNAYLRENRRPNCVGIIECLKRIDPESIGHLEDDLVFRLLIRLQKQYKMYAKRWQTTFKKWIREANRPGLGCYYAGIFLTNDYLPNRT